MKQTTELSPALHPVQLPLQEASSLKDFQNILNSIFFFTLKTTRPRAKTFIRKRWCLLTSLCKLLSTFLRSSGFTSWFTHAVPCPRKSIYTFLSKICHSFIKFKFAKFCCYWNVTITPLLNKVLRGRLCVCGQQKTRKSACSCVTVPTSETGQGVCESAWVLQDLLFRNAAGCRNEHPCQLIQTWTTLAINFSILVPIAFKTLPSQCS